MKPFKDSEGRQWVIQLNITTAKRCRDLLQVNLLEPEAGDPPLLTRLGTDEILLIDVIYCLLKEQADQKGISDEDFGRALNGDAVLAAVNAFYAELVDFFQSRGRKDRVTAIQKQLKVIELAIQAGVRQIDQVNIESLIEKTLGSLSMNSPESAE